MSFVLRLLMILVVCQLVVACSGQPSKADRQSSKTDSVQQEKVQEVEKPQKKKKAKKAKTKGRDRVTVSSSGEVDTPGVALSSIVSMGKAGLDPQKPSTLSWLDDVVVIGEPVGASKSTLQNWTKQIVEQLARQKGYPTWSYGGDFQLRATVVFDSDSLEHQQLLRDAGVEPGLVGGGDTRDTSKGSLILELKQGRANRWKGAVQIYFLPELDDEMRYRRLATAVGQLLSTWP